MADLFSDIDAAAAATGAPGFADPQADFLIRRAQIDRRRKLAEGLAAAGAQMDTGAGYHGGRVFAVGNILGPLAQSVGGQLMEQQADKADAELALQQRMAQSDWSKRYDTAPDDATRQQLIVEARNNGLRYDLENAFRKEEADRIGKREDKAIELSSKAEIARETAAARAQERQDQREWQEGQNRLYRRTAEQLAASGARGGKSPEDAELDRELKQARLDAIRNPKPVASERKAALAQDDLISRVDNALTELDRNPDAVGFRTYVPNVALNRLDPQGTAARAAIGELSAEKAHDIYGASFTAAERARADKFIPADGDDIQTVRTKLANMKKMAEQARARAVGQQPKQAPQQPNQSTRLKFNPATGRLE